METYFSPPVKRDDLPAPADNSTAACHKLCCSSAAEEKKKKSVSSSLSFFLFWCSLNRLLLLLPDCLFFSLSSLSAASRLRVFRAYVGGPRPEAVASFSLFDRRHPRASLNRAGFWRLKCRSLKRRSARALG